MGKERLLVIVLIGLVAVAAIAFLGGVMGSKNKRARTGQGERIALKCAWDGTKLIPIYQVDAFLDDGSTKAFCSLYCAKRWFNENRDRVVYFTVVDEVTGQKFDSTLGHFVESDVVTVPEVKNRIHAFANKEDALKHARQFHGKLVENPLDEAFIMPKIAQFEKLRIGVPLLPDALPLRLAIYKPIFKENRLSVDLVHFRGENGGGSIFSEGSIDGILCDLPAGLLLSKSGSSARIVKNVLRANPFRALFAIVGETNRPVKSLEEIEGKTIAVPMGITFQFYAEFYLKRFQVSPEKVVMRKVEDVKAAWDLLKRGEVSASLLRTPYTDMARALGMPFLADDRSLPWMSVLVIKESVISKKFDAIKRFVFALEQSVLALNVKPGEYSTLLEEKGGIPDESRKNFPMPLFEGANAPSQEEVEPVLAWLVENGLVSRETSYDDFINSQFLPNPDDVGLAFCCR